MENEAQIIKNMIFESGSVDEIIDKNFYIICFNVLCHTNEEEYIPNEIGVAKYSIGHGVEESYHCFIDPGVIPMGYKHDAKQLSEDTHAIPILGFEQSDNNYKKICDKILDIVNPMNKEVAPVFCQEENLEQNRGCIQWLSFKAGYLDMEDIHFYDITCLLMELHAYVGKAFSNRAAAIELLHNPAFDYTPCTRCYYHEELDNAYCALAYAKRICFIFSDVLCTLYGIECTPNHLPLRVNESLQVEIHQFSLPPSRIRRKHQPARRKASERHVPRNISEKNIVSEIVNIQISDGNTNAARPWMKEFRGKPQQEVPQPEVSSIRKKNYSSLKSTKSSTHKETRQPFTVPLVLSSSTDPRMRQPVTFPLVLNNEEFLLKP